MGDFQLADGSGLSIFLQYYPPGSYPTATFENDSGLTAENWSYACVAESYRYGIDGVVTALASLAASTTANAPADPIAHSLDLLLNIFAADGATVMSAPAFGSIQTQENSYGPGRWLVSSSDPTLSPTSPLMFLTLESPALRWRFGGAEMRGRATADANGDGNRDSYGDRDADRYAVRSDIDCDSDCDRYAGGADSAHSRHPSREPYLR